MTENASDPIVIVAARRTAMGGFQGVLSSVPGPQLGAKAVRAATGDAGIEAGEVDEIFMGCVLPAGAKQAPARQAALYGGLDESTPATTVNKVCGSGMKAIMLAHDAIALGRAEIAVAGGMESMSQAPYLLEKARGGYRLGHGEIKDHMFLDGLEDAYEGRLMGTYAEEVARHYQFTREAQDAYAIRSLNLAKEAQANGCFDAEIVPVEVKTRKGTQTVEKDEQPLTADTTKIPNLKPAFATNGTVTAANSSSISDGAAALVLMKLSTAKARGLEPIAAIRGQSMHAQQPAWFVTAPVEALKKLSRETGWGLAQVPLFEINEAFAVVPMAAVQELSLDEDRVNVFGGACALGHPIGASGARVVVTLLNAMEKKGVDRGMATLCIGGGEATALAVERL